MTAPPLLLVAIILAQRVDREYASRIRQAGMAVRICGGRWPNHSHPGSSWGAAAEIEYGVISRSRRGATPASITLAAFLFISGALPAN